MREVFIVFALRHYFLDVKTKIKNVKDFLSWAWKSYLHAVKNKASACEVCPFGQLSICFLRIDQIVFGTTFLLIHINRQAYAERGACCQRRTIVIGLRFEVEEVVNGRVEMEATPDMVLQHEFPDGIALIHISAAWLRFAEVTAGECSIKGIVARETMVVA